MEIKNKTDLEKRHNANAPYWAVAFVLLCGAGISTGLVDLGNFWKGYVLDITGPGWNYILFRGLFTTYTDNKWTRFFTPVKTVLIFISVCIAIETAQYFNLYDATFDPWDFLAYVLILIPIFLIDSKIRNKYL